MSEPIKCINGTSEAVLHAAVVGGVGYLCARAFINMNPVSGGVFCAVTSLISRFVNPLFEMIFNHKGASEASKTIGGLVSTCVCISAAVGVSKLVGFPITLASGYLLICSIIAIKILAILGLALVSALIVV